MTSLSVIMTSLSRYYDVRADYKKEQHLCRYQQNLAHGTMKLFSQ